MPLYPYRSHIPRWLGEQAVAWGGLALAWQAGQWLSRVLDLPLPGPLTGMALLLFFLVGMPSAAARLHTAARPLLVFMPLFIVPAGTKVVTLAPRLAAAWLPITLVVFLSTGLALAVTALVVRALVRWETGKGKS